MQSDETGKRNYFEEVGRFIKQNGSKTLFLIVLVFLAAGITLLAVGDNLKSISVDPYPSEMILKENGENTYLEKLYHLTGNDQPGLIPKDDLKWEGRTYHFVELGKADETETAIKAHTETITLDCLSKNMEDVLKVIAPTWEVMTPDGYYGELILDPASIRIEAKGYQNQKYHVSATRTYPNLAEADTSLIPKTITEKGRTLSLKDISWQNARSDYMDGYDIALRYTAVATYDTTVTAKAATGYVVIADYKGEVVNTDIVYKAVYEKEKLFGISDIHGGISVFLYLVVFLIVLAALLFATNWGKKQYEHYINRKRGYEA